MRKADFEGVAGGDSASGSIGCRLSLSLSAKLSGDGMVERRKDRGTVDDHNKVVEEGVQSKPTPQHGAIYVYWLGRYVGVKGGPDLAVLGFSVSGANKLPLSPAIGARWLKRHKEPRRRQVQISPILRSRKHSGSR